MIVKIKSMKYLYTLIAIVFYMSANAQIAWTSGINISTNTFSNERPQIALDRAGNPMVIWGRMSDESVFFSKWNGTLFSPPIKLNPSWLTVATADWMGPAIAAHGDTVYVVVKRTPETSDTNRLFVISSFNGGNSFNAPVELAFIGDSISRLPTITTDDMGNPIVAYMKFNASSLDSRWVVTRSNDYGLTFTSDVKVSGWGNSTEVCDCCPGSVASSGNEAIMMYRDNNLNTRDIWASHSSDNANTFPIGFSVDINGWFVVSCPSSGPDGEIIGDTLYTTFMSRGSGSFRAYINKSSISSGSLSTVSTLTGPITGLTLQNFPKMAKDGNAMAIVWRQVASGQASLPLLYTNDVSNGFPVAYDTVDIDNITNTDVAIKNGNIYVVWQDDNSGTVKFRSGNYTPGTTGIEEPSSANFSIYPNPSEEFITINSKNNHPFQVNIFNSLGEKVYSSNQEQKLRLPIETWTNGLYLIQINTGNNLFDYKFVKQ